MNITMKCKLAELLEARNINQKILAAETGLSPTTVGKLYRNQFDRVDRHTIETLLKYFGLDSLDKLFYIVIS